MPETLIKCENVGKIFCRDFKRSLWYGVRDIVSDLLPRSSDDFARTNARGTLRTHEFWANRDVSFEVSRGECLGLLGRNGAGKTTLLKMLNGLIKPDTGRIQLQGRVGAMIALGAGFNPVLTGRENVYVNGSILGLSRRQIDDRFEEIVEFAELQNFIDGPVRNYSSGMQVRLGFAVAAMLLRPDILILDEVLAVGDIGFVIKCLNAVRNIARNAAVIFVSHNMESVQTFTSHAMVMDAGSVVHPKSDTVSGVLKYLSLFSQEVQESGNGMAQVEKVRFTTLNSGSDELPWRNNQPGLLRFRLRLRDGANHARVRIYVADETSRPVTELCLSNTEGMPFELLPGEYELAVRINPLQAAIGRYSFIIVVQETGSNLCLCRKQGIAAFTVDDGSSSWARLLHPAVAEAVALER